MQLIVSAAALLLAASSAMASPAVRRQAELDTKVRIILRDDAGNKEETFFNSVPGNIRKGFSPAFLVNTLEVDVGADANPALRCAVTADDGVNIFAERGDTFSDGTNGEWTFDGPTAITVVICDESFVANNRNEDDA